MLRQAFLLVLSLAAAVTAGAAAPTAAQLSQARIAGLAWLMTHQSGDGSWKDASGVSVQATSAAITAIVNAGIKQGYPLTAALAYLQNAQPGSVDALARQIVTLNNIGVNVGPQVALLNQWQNGKNAWGAYKGYGSSLPDTPLAMSALFQTHAFNTTTATNTLCYGLLYAQRSDNSFSYLANGTNTPASQASGNLVPTAYAALALNATFSNTGWNSLTCYQLVNGSYVPTTFTFSTMVSNAVSWMLSKQSTTDGGFGDSGQSMVLETGVAYLTLNQLSSSTYATQLGNAQGYLVAQQNADGSWGGDPLATALALQTLPTLTTGALADSNNNGVPDVVETYLGWTPSAPNRQIAVGNGQSVVGTTTATVLVSATELQAFSYSLTVPAGTAPYVWSISSGYLPDGLTLNTATGQITGTPTTPGAYSFNYTVTDANNVITNGVAQIVITAAGDGDINGDGVVDTADVALAKRITLGLITPTATQLAHGDVSGGDQVVDVRDVARIRRKALGLENF